MHTKLNLVLCVFLISSSCTGETKKLKTAGHSDQRHLAINTPVTQTSGQHLLGQDGHDQKNHTNIQRHKDTSHLSTKATTTSEINIPDISSSPKPAKAPSSTNVVVSSDGVSRNKTTKEKLREKLLKTDPPYDKEQMPVRTDNTPVNVSLGLAVLHIDIDESKSVMTVDTWIRMLWTDEHLKWNKTDYNVSQLHFAADELWRPDVMLYNNADGASEQMFGNTRFLVFSTGEVLWVPPAKLRAFCKLDLRYWPMDTQVCNMKFASWTAHGGQINIGLYKDIAKVEDHTFYTNNREWDLKSHDAKTKTVSYECCNESYPDVTFTFVLQRNSPAYKSVIILPCLILMLVTGCSFLLTPESGEKIIVSGIALIGVLMYLIYFAMSLPFHQHSVPIIVSFYSNTAGLIGIAIFLNVVCMNMARERKYSSPPKFLLHLFSGRLGRLLCLGHYTHQVSATHQRLVVELSDMAESEQQAEGEIAVDSGRSSANGAMGRGGGSHPLDMDNNHHQRQDCSTNFPSGNYYAQRHQPSLIMKDWVLVAAGLERLFFLIYGLAFAIVTSVYV